VRNRVITYLPGKMLMTTGSASPQFPEVRKGGTWGVFQFERIDSGKATRLRLGVFRWRDGIEWDGAFAYVGKNNPVFLRMIRKRFQDGPSPPPPSWNRLPGRHRLKPCTRRLLSPAPVRRSGNAGRPPMA
jgi:hypothetical protein